MNSETDRWAKDAYYLRGITHVHHFYTKRTLWVYSALWAKVKDAKVSLQIKSKLFFWLQSLAIGQTRMNRYFEASYSQVNRYLKGTLYIGPKTSEVSPWYAFSGKIKRLAHSMPMFKQGDSIISTNSFTQLLIPDSTIDYIFTDPPFGHNIQYSELNFIWESWLKVFSNPNPEAVINLKQGKQLEEYRLLMFKCFKEAYRVLKPGRWITVIFHNSKASVWNAIQDSLAKAGFIVAQVVILDKQQQTMTQYAYPGAVQNDLVINAYKPRSEFSQRFAGQTTGRGLEAEFIHEHLLHLPVAANIERSKEMLYSKYLAYYVQHGYQVAYNGEQFYRALPQWGLVESDGYWFIDEVQTNEYEKRKVKAVPVGKKSAPLGQQVLFISDEKSARLWLWGFLDQSRTYDEIYTAFIRVLQTPEDQIPELRTMLEEGFVRVDGVWKRPDTFTQAELEKRRRERLLRQFDEYLQAVRTGQKLKEVRREALVAGFIEAYRENRFQDILAVGRRLDRRLLEESPELFDFVGIAESKTSE